MHANANLIVKLNFHLRGMFHNMTFVTERVAES